MAGREPGGVDLEDPLLQDQTRPTDLLSPPNNARVSVRARSKPLVGLL